MNKEIKNNQIKHIFNKIKSDKKIRPYLYLLLMMLLVMITTYIAPINNDHYLTIKIVLLSNIGFLGVILAIKTIDCFAYKSYVP